MSDNIVVALRLRPFISRELNEENEKHWEAQENSIVQYEPRTKKPINSFAFDEVFDVNMSNEKIYNDLAHPIVQSGLAGFNGTIFAYGQTSSGKTYTMTGTSSTLGIIPLAIQNIFNSIENMPDREFLLRASYMEIYQENIYDLLTGEKITTVREDSHGQVLVLGLKEVCVINEDMLLAVMSDGDKRRKVGETNMNERSSRSHSIFRLIIESKERGDKDCQGAITVSHLNLVDLAGSENASQTGAVGERLKEGGSINKSLFMLGRVISQLSEGEQHINFRDSKLTRILQNSLGGNAKTVIICTVTPANKEQTLSTVRFACRAKNIKNKPIINEVVSDAALLKRYALEIKRLRQALENERNTDKAQEMEQVKEKLDEQEKQNMELNGKIIALKEKLVVSSHPHVSSNAVDLKKRRMTWAAPVFRKPLRMSLATCSPLSMLKSDDAFIPFGNRIDNTCEAVEKPTLSQGDSLLYCISEEENVTPDEIPKINISTCSFEGNPEAEGFFDENEISKLMDDCFISPKAVAPRRRKRVRFSILPKPNIDVACQTEEIVNLPLTPNLLSTPTKETSSSPVYLTPEGQTPREILRSRVQSLKEILETKEIALHEWQDEIKEIEMFHRNELQEVMGTYEEYKELGEKIEYLKKSLEDSEGLCIEANKRISEQVQEIKVLKDQVNSLEKERDNLRKQTQDFQNYSEEVHTLRKECKEKTALIEKLQNEKIDFDMKMELALQKQKETESYLRKSLEDAWEESAQYEKGLNSETLERKSIFKSFEEELEKKKEQLEAFMLEKENLSKALKSAKEEIKVTKDELKKMTGTNEELANEIVSLQNKNYSFQRNRISSTVSETQKFKELNDTLYKTCEESSMEEQTCIMSSSISMSQNEVSRRLSETIQYLDESLSSALLSPESDLKDVVGIKEELCKLKEMLISPEFLQGVYSQEVFALDNIPQSSLSLDEFMIKTEYTSDVEKLHLLESIYEDFIQYSRNVYSSPSVIHMHENLEKIPGDKFCKSSRDKSYEVTNFSFCDETMNLSLYSQIGNGLNLADELKLADSNQTLVDDDKCSSLADELHVAESNRTLVDDNKCSSFPFKKEDSESFIKENIDMDSSVLKREACTDCHHCCEKEKVLMNLNKKIILQNEISDKLQAEVKILQKREKELENELNIKSGKQKDLENELNIIKKKEKDLIGDLLRRETDLKNMEFEMKEIKEQHSCTILEMKTKENELLVQIEKLKEKEGEYLNELNELREKEEEVESMIMEFLEKEKFLEEKKNKLDRETNCLKNELLENSTIINDLKSKIVDYEKELEILRSQKYESCKVEEKKGCDCKLVLDSDSNNHMKLELHRLTKDLVEKENLLQETEKELKKNVKELEDKLLEKSDAINNLEFEVNDCKKELEMYKTQKSDGFLNDEEKEIHRSSLIVPSSDCSIELEVQRLTKELLEKENLLEEKEREFIDKIDSLEDDLKEKFLIINKLDSELADCKKELEMLKPEKPDFANATEKEYHSTSILVLPSSEPKEIEIHRLTEEKEALQRELEVFQEIISSLELESTTREMELDHAKQELNLARCKIKDLTKLHSSLSKKLNQTETLVESVHEDISRVRLKESEDSESYDANMDKRESVCLTDVGDVTQLNKESEDKTDRVDKLTRNEIKCDSNKLSKDIFDDDSNKKLRENIIVSLTEVTISEDQKLNSFLAEHCVKSSEDLEKMLNQIGLLLKRKQEEIEKLKLEKREKKEEIKEDYDVINNCEREKLLDEVKQKDKICEELNYELENLKELFRKLENENISNRETLEKLNRLLQCFNLTGIEGIETVLKEALSPSNDLKLDPINIESKSVECSKVSCLHSGEHLNPNVDIAIEHTREVCESSNINVNELVTIDHEVLKTSQSLSSSSLEKFEDSRIEEPDILPKTNKSCHELNISECDKLKIELFSENLQEKPLNNTENNLETAENSKRRIKSSEILDDIDNNYSLKYKILEEEVNSKQKEIDSVLEEMEKCKRNILSLEEVNGKLKSELNYNKDTIDSLLKEVDHFKNLNILVSEEKSKLLIEIEGNLKVCGEKDCEIKRLSDIVKELEIKIEVKVKDYIILKEKVEKIEAILRLHNIEDVDSIEKALSEKASMQVQLSELDQDCNALKEKVASLVENQERMAILSVELDELKKAFDEKVIEEVNMITKMKKNIDIITEKDNEIKINKETIDSLKSDNEEMNKKNISLREDLNAYDELLMSHSLQGTTDLKRKLAEIELFKESNREKDEMNRSLKEKLCKYDEILTLYKLENTENLKEELNRINALIVSNEEKEKNIKFINEKVIEIESLLKYHNLQGINDLDLELKKYKDVLQELKEKNDECKSLKYEVKDYFAVKEEKELLSVEVELLRKEKESYFVKEKELNDKIMKKIALQEEYEVQIEKLENMVRDLQTEKEINPKKDRLEKLDIILNTYNVFDIENLEKTLRNEKDLSEELSVKNQECKELKHDMDILFSDQATLVETLQERQIALEEHTNALKERDEVIKTLETDLDDLKRVHEECAEKAMKDTLEIENYINIIEKYEFEMTEKEEKSQKIVKEYEIITNDISDLNSKLKICQETETFFRDENRRLKLELLESVKKIKALEKDLKELNLEYNNLKGEHQQMDISVFNSKIKQYQESEALFRDENSRLKMELLDSAGKHEALEKDLKDLRVEYNNLKDKHQPLNGNEEMVELNIKLNTLQSENHDLNSEVKNLREQLNEEKDKNKSLDEELDNLDKYYKDCIENYIWTVKDLKGKNKTLAESLKSYKKMNTTNSENVSVDTVVDSKNTSNSEEIHNLKSENRKLSDLVSKLQEENKSLKSSKKMHTINYENVSMDTVVDSKNISNSEEIHNLKTESRKLANLVSKLQEENKSLKSSKKMHTTNYENVSMDTVVDSKNISNSEEIHNLKTESRKLANLVSKLQEENKSLKSSKKMHTTNYGNVSMDTVVDSKNISNSEEIHNLKSESRKLANLVSKLQEENKSLKSSKKMHTTNYENVSMDTVVDSKYISNSEEFYNIQLENRKLANLVSSLQEEIELLKKREARKNQEVQTEKDSIDGDEASLREQIFNLKKDNNVLKIQLQAIQAPIKNEAQRWKDELKFEQEKNKKLMSELRRVRNENCDSSIINTPSNTEVKGSSRGGEQACGFGSGVVLDIQVMRLKNANYHLEKEKEKMQNEMASLKENVEWYKAKGSEWKTKCYKEEKKVQKLTQKLKTGDEVKNTCSADKTPAEHKAINAQEKEEILKPTPKLKLEDEPKIKNDVDITPAEQNQKNIKISGPKYSSTSSKKIYITPEELARKAFKEESLIEPCVLQEAPQNTPLQSVEKFRHTKKDEGATASGKENQTKNVRESRKSDECKVQ